MKEITKFSAKLFLYSLTILIIVLLVKETTDLLISISKDPFSLLYFLCVAPLYIVLFIVAEKASKLLEKKKEPKKDSENNNTKKE